ncbi:MAG: (2Fe-2S)-binding protein [Desulfovermiculus sp.]|nr:(2Fe-2S)-binding protein [Desulfovermiculus sp.]
MKQDITLTVNGQEHRLQVQTQSTLLDVLRDELHLSSVRRSCGEGECGACTVLVNNEPVNSCLVLAISADGQRVITSEGLSRGNQLHPLMQSFVDNHGFQCGFCTSGILMTSYAVLNENQELDDTQVRKSLEGHMCRCTGYVNIVKSVQAAKEDKDAGNWW